MTARPKAVAPAFALSLSATAAGAEDYRAEIMARVIEPCFMYLAHLEGGLTVSVSPSIHLRRYEERHPLFATRRLDRSVRVPFAGT